MPWREVELMMGFSTPTTISKESMVSDAIIRFVAIGGLLIVIGDVTAQRVVALQPPATPPASGKPRQPVARPPMRVAKPVESAPLPIGAPLLLSLESLPTNYPGDAIEAVVAGLKAGPKGEF